MSRIAPIDPPYDDRTQALFDLVMPEGVEPLELFRVMATSQRLFPRFMRAGVLDRGPVPARDREIVIHRTTARCGAEYEWGVHASAFGRPLGLGDEVLRATLHGSPDDPAFDERQRALVRLCDELHETSSVSDATWEVLGAFFDDSQRLELLYTAGLYHCVSFLVNGLRLTPEKGAARFSDYPPAPAGGGPASAT